MAIYRETFVPSYTVQSKYWIMTGATVEFLIAWRNGKLRKWACVATFRFSDLFIRYLHFTILANCWSIFTSYDSFFLHRFTSRTIDKTWPFRIYFIYFDLFISIYLSGQSISSSLFFNLKSNQKTQSIFG